MKDVFLNVQFTQPLFLWMLVALPLLWLWFRRRGMFVLIWRTLILALIIAILADPQIVTVESTTERRIYAFDLSESISRSMRQWMAKTGQEAGSPKQEDFLFVFGGKTERSTNWQASLQEGTGERQAIQPQKTNLEQLFTTLLTLSPGGAHDVFLFTDGWQTEGNLERMFPAIAASGLRIYPVLPTRHLDFANVSVTKLLAPTQGKSGESITLKVSLENQSDHEVAGTLALSRDGQVFKTDRVQLKPGSQIFTYQTTLAEKSLTSYRANFTPREPQSDRYAPDNQALAWVSVRTKAKVLLLNGRPGSGRYLEEILRRQGYEVVSQPPESAPALAGYSIVILNNVERKKFSPSYLTAIERHVAEGNGFIMVGSEWSFGPGGYRHTPIETILPVEFREPKREEKHRAVVLVIDKSGSMREDNRILYAQEAAKAVARQLKDNDLLGVVGFDVNPFVVVPISNVGSIRGTVDKQIARLKPGGRTFLLPAIIEAKRQLERQNASTKHVIILSDGETGGSGGDYIDLVNVMKTEQKITVSTVAIGAEANVPLMKRISQYGGGFFHHTYDPATLPQIVVQQLRERPKDEPPVEKHFTPVQERGSEVLAGFRSRNFPSLAGYIETEIKRNGHVDLMFPRDGRRIPLLASWQYGRGRTVALTTDMEGRWSRNWIQWGALGEFWEKIMHWLRPVPKSVAIPLHETRVSLSGTQPLLDLYLYDDVGRDSQFHFSLSGTPAKLEGVLKKLAPGHYQTALPISAKGDYRIDLFEERAGQRIAYPPIGYTLPYDLTRESPRPDFNIPLLTKLAQISGGEINPKSLKLSQKRHQTASYRPLRAPLIILCWVLFLLEVVVRKMLLRDGRVSSIPPNHPLTS
jgi:Ca-activated chloride channel family protein